MPIFCWGLMQPFSMVDLKGVHHPTISYRRIRPSDLVLLEKIHCDLFPIRYESEFFHNVVNGHDIVSWGAVDCSRPNGQNDELIGFVTARVVQAKDSEIEDLLSFDSSKSDQTLVYILTLGVVESYRNFGIATSLVREVINYASSILTCRAVYLHVISYNMPAIHFYEKMSFQCVRKLHGFYFINGQHYDSFLFIYYLNGGRSPCSPLELLTRIAAYVRNGLNLVAAKLWKNDGKKASRWPNNKETCCLLTSTHNKRSILMTQEIISKNSK
ncbi:histone acetyltransferase MCC1-like [Camellia sinensis]|uniref:histone acetyltransferase MCC1-like n=1 Tax=Camellia sinensis TaxID=4442 RepID=UPI00103621BB|nr:histone acetyltransferase MCC1-like [Camellia sinensis]XP_028100430.1 histone acetyltransferase MCC1-like [Camellia sinensis]